MEKKQNKLLLAALVPGTALLLRSPITSVGPVLDMIRAELGSSSTVLGLLTTFILVMFAVVSPFAGAAGNRLGTGRAVIAGLLVSVIGITVRSVSGLGGILIGTLLTGAGIAVVNVLIPVLIKKEFSGKVGLMTGLFTMGMAFFSGLAAAVSRPVAEIPGVGWRGSLLIWGALSLVCLLLWFPYRKLRTSGGAGKGISWGTMLRSRTAWRVSLFMAAQSFIFYCFVAWLPSILVERNIDATVAGYFTFAYQAMGIPASFLMPPIAAKSADQRKLIALVGAVYTAGLALVLLGQSFAPLLIGVLICGFCTNSCFSLCMVLIPLRTETAEDAAKLSGMVQSFGYAVSAIGPILMGALYDATGSFLIPMLVLCGVTVLLTAGSGRIGRGEMLSSR